MLLRTHTDNCRLGHPSARARRLYGPLSNSIGGHLAVVFSVITQLKTVFVIVAFDSGVFQLLETLDFADANRLRKIQRQNYEGGSFQVTVLTLSA